MLGKVHGLLLGGGGRGGGQEGLKVVLAAQVTSPGRVLCCVMSPVLVRAPGGVEDAGLGLGYSVCVLNGMWR